MLKNYITIAINNLLKNKLYSAINIIGLAIGLAACIVISLYVNDQYSYDKQWENSDRIYRVNFFENLPNSEPYSLARTPLPAMPQLAEYFKDKIEKSARMLPWTWIIDTGSSKFEETLVEVDPAFIEIFQLEEIEGSFETTLARTTNIALSEEVARRFFGKQNPIGKNITVHRDNYRVDYTVTAVYRVQGNTILNLPLLSLLDFNSKPEDVRSWYAYITGSFFKLKDGVDIETLKPRLPAFIDRKIDYTLLYNNPDKPLSSVLSIDFQRLETAHIDTPWDHTRAGGNKTVIMSFAAIAILILITGCINFTLLTTAKAARRAREVAMRKVVGAKRKQLIIQFLGESIFIALLSMLLSFGAVEFMLPVFESIVGKTLFLDYTDPFILISLPVLLFVVGVSGGLYPAFILSGYRPGNTLKSIEAKNSGSPVSLRSVLIFFQFSVSIILIILTGAIYSQMRYSLNRDPGYNKHNLLIIDRMGQSDVFKNKISSLKNELLNSTNITDVSLSDITPGRARGTGFTLSRPDQLEISHSIGSDGIDYDFFKTYQIPLIAGRSFTIGRDLPEPEIDPMDITLGDHASDPPIERSIVVNASAVKQFGFKNAEDALGKVLRTTTMNNTYYTVIGVTADNHMLSINAPPTAQVYLLKDYMARPALTVRFKGSPHKALTLVESVWKKVIGDTELSTVFADQLMAQEFVREETEIKIFISFSILAIIIACMGLYGSASFTVEQRTKEIGLRKVMGAKVKNISALILWQFSKPVLTANIVAWPVALFVMQHWLERFPYRFNIWLMISICLVSGLIALAIAWVTVAGNTTRVAKSRPVKSLRYE